MRNTFSEFLRLSQQSPRPHAATYFGSLLTQKGVRNPFGSLTPLSVLFNANIMSLNPYFLIYKINNVDLHLLDSHYHGYNVLFHQQYLSTLFLHLSIIVLLCLQGILKTIVESSTACGRFPAQGYYCLLMVEISFPSFQ